MSIKIIESVLYEIWLFSFSVEFVKQVNISGLDVYDKLCAEAEKDLIGFWGRFAREYVLWCKPFM